VVFIISSGTTFLFANSQYNQSFVTQHAIVFSTRTNIYSAPNTSSTVLFVIHNGLKVKVLKTEQKWLNIMLPDGSIGWIPEETLAVI
jgi:SH3-like domain-containing protein